MILIHLSIPLYICKHNLQAARDRENCGSKAVLYNSVEVRAACTEYTILDKN